MNEEQLAKWKRDQGQVVIDKLKAETRKINAEALILEHQSEHLEDTLKKAYMHVRKHNAGSKEYGDVAANILAALRNVIGDEALEHWIFIMNE